jgi:hypothetical protein
MNGALSSARGAVRENDEPCLVCGTVNRPRWTLMREPGERPWLVCIDAEACRARAGDPAPL